LVVLPGVARRFILPKRQLLFSDGRLEAYRTRVSEKAEKTKFAEL
jgi:hypothetical protein